MLLGQSYALEALAQPLLCILHAALTLAHVPPLGTALKSCKP